MFAFCEFIMNMWSFEWKNPQIIAYKEIKPAVVYLILFLMANQKTFNFSEGKIAEYKHTHIYFFIDKS